MRTPFLYFYLFLFLILFPNIRFSGLGPEGDKEEEEEEVLAIILHLLIIWPLDNQDTPPLTNYSGASHNVHPAKICLQF